MAKQFHKWQIIMFLPLVSLFISCERHERHIGTKNTLRPGSFEEFASHFKAEKLPFAIKGTEDDYDVFRRQDKESQGPVNNEKDSFEEYTPFREKTIAGFNDYISELKENEFSRNVVTNCSYIASLYKDSRISALCYYQINGFNDSLGPFHFIISTYDNKNGKRIDRLVFAGQTSPYLYLDGVFKPDLTAVVTTTENTWLKKPEKEGFQGNRIISQKQISQVTYRIESDGHFKKLNEKTQIAFAR